MKFINHKGNRYPEWQASGFSARFAFPFAKEVCKGEGYDIGCNRPEWCYPTAFPIDPLLDSEYNAMQLPDKQVDYIFSSHCLEHLDRWVNVLDYWHSKLKEGGTLFLYLPDHSQTYWRAWSNRKHVNQFTGQIIFDYFADQPEMWKDVIVSAPDLNHSFIAIATKV